MLALHARVVAVVGLLAMTRTAEATPIRNIGQAHRNDEATPV